MPLTLGEIPATVPNIMLWHLSHRYDPEAAALADRHYSRQKPGTSNIAPPGRCLVLFVKTTSGQAVWVTSFQFPRYVDHAWPGAWVCSMFRNEGAALSSTLIKDAIRATRHYFGPPPSAGMITFVDPSKVAAKPILGWCFIRAGFKPIGDLPSGLQVLQLRSNHIPAPQPPLLAYDDEWTLHRKRI